MTINDRIKEIRKAAGLSQADFGSRVGISFAAVSNIERYINTPSEQTIRAICSEFGISRTWLETGEGDMYAKQADSDEEAIIRAMYGQSEAKKRLIAILASMPDEMYEAFEKAYAERLAQEKSDP